MRTVANSTPRLSFQYDQFPNMFAVNRYIILENPLRWMTCGMLSPAMRDRLAGDMDDYERDGDNKLAIADPYAGEFTIFERSAVEDWPETSPIPFFPYDDDDGQRLL